MAASRKTSHERFSEEIRAIATRLGPGALLALACGHAHRIFDAQLELGICQAEVVDEIVKAALYEEDRQSAGASSKSGALHKTVSLLATMNGLSLRETGTTGQYKLVDGPLFLPEVNASQNGIWFTLAEAFAFLETRPPCRTNGYLRAS